MSYTQLTQEQRYQIYALLKTVKKQIEISKLLGVHKSSISRELKRNKGLCGYRPKQAQQLSIARNREKVKPKILESTWSLVEKLCRKDWSPEQISGWLLKYEKIQISYESIYLYIYRDKAHGGTLHTHLRCQKKRRKRYGGRDRRGQIKGRVSIEQRPAIVDDRCRIGDWEADLVIGRPGGKVLVTLAERKSRLVLMGLAINKTAKAVTGVILGLLKPVANRVYTITYDNGKEFAFHKKISTTLRSKGFFAHPYSSWERGLNENSNGLIRQYLAKGSSFDSVTQKEVKIIMHKLNNRPKKCIAFKTPNNVFFRSNTSVALAS